MATLTPYVTPETLVSAETGISFKTVPYPGASATEQLAEQVSPGLTSRPSLCVDCGVSFS